MGTIVGDVWGTSSVHQRASIPAPAMAMSKPEVFGDPVWKTIHAFAAASTTPEKRKEYKRFVEVTIPMLLPCQNPCAKHWSANLKGKYPIEKYMGSEEQLLLWTYLMHSFVSDQTGKPPEHTPSYNEVKRLYLPSSGEVVCSTICHAGSDNGEEHTAPPRRVKKLSAKRGQPAFKYR